MKTNTNNLFDNIQQKRASFKKYAEKALENQWITKEDFDAILYKIANDKLVIGVIGQMKAGKSTFLNALIFKNEVLPAATTPMTASLSIITYGVEKKIEAEFYTSVEWAELKQFSLLDAANYEGDNNQKSKIKAAKEIIAKSVKIENELPILLGSKKVDAFEKLIEYVGADGKYTAITKSVRIEYPLDYLKGVEIVDTPGFNDPVASREERTKEFLSRADVVVMLLYAGRAFDATDNDIIFNKVRSIGIGKLLIGVNKYDINYLNGETNEMQVSYVKEQLLKASEEHSSSSIASLVQEQDPLLISANMALLSQLDMAKISGSEDYSFHYNKLMEEFEISTQTQMYEKSLMPAFEDAIRNIVTNSKEEILIKKPLNQIKQSGENQINKLNKEKLLVDNELVILKKPDADLDDLLRTTKKAEKRINQKIEGLEIEFEEIVLESVKKINIQIRDILLSYKHKCKEIVSSKRIVIRFSGIENEIVDKLECLERDVQRVFERINPELNRQLTIAVNSLIRDIEEIIDKYLEDFDFDDYMKIFKRHFLKDIIQVKLQDLMNIDAKEGLNLKKRVGVFVYPFIIGSPFSVIHDLSNILEAKSLLNDYIDKYFASINVDRIREKVTADSSTLIENIRGNLLHDFMEPIIQNTEKLLADKSNKECRVENLEVQLETVKTSIKKLSSQIMEMKVLEESLSQN